MALNKYNWKITAKKFSWSLLEVLVAGVISVYSNQPWFLILVPIVEALRNYIKHRK